APLPGAPELARSVANSLFAAEFDISFFRGKPIDHGCFSPLSMLANPDGSWPWKVLPLQVGVLQFPIPTARRCYRLGAALGRAVRAHPSDLREVIMWLIMRGAMTERIRRLHRTYYLPSMTAIATAIYENDGAYPPLAPYRDQLEGAERLAGTYPYTLERSAKAYRLNGFLHDLIIPEHRE